MRSDLDNEYFRKVIHIIPNADFTDKTFEPASAEASLELNRYDDVQGINSGYYNFLKIKNFESVDAIASENNGIYHLYQITIARKHDTKVNNISPILIFKTMLQQETKNIKDGMQLPNEFVTI
ncbi:unnamed protein product [Rhizophagus irregularis]|nr:unnamed protein product [Rhizophagus irregularis]